MTRIPTSIVAAGAGEGSLETTEVHTHLGSVFVSCVRQLSIGRNVVEVLELGCVP